MRSRSNGRLRLVKFDTTERPPSQEGVLLFDADVSDVIALGCGYPAE